MGDEDVTGEQQTQKMSPDVKLDSVLNATTVI